MNKIDEAIECNKQGIYRYKAKEYESALRYFEEAILLNPEFWEPFFNAGNALFDLKRYNEAFDYYDKATKLNPTYMNADVWNNLGNELFNSGELLAAVQFYDRSLSIDSNNVYPLRNKGLALGNLGQSKEALIYLDNALSINPKFLEAIMDKGSILLDLKEYKSARSCYEMALEHSPNNIVALTNIGVAFYGLKDYENAEKYFDKSIKIAKGRDLGSFAFSALCGKAKVQYRLDNYRETINYANEALEINNRSPYPWIIKGLGLLGLDLPSEAKDCFEKALNIDKTSTDALFGLAFYYSDYAFQNEKALEICLEILKIEPTDLKTREAIAEKYVELGKYKEGRECALQILSEISDIEIQCVMKLIVVVSYLQDGSIGCEREVSAFLEFITELNNDFKISRSTWTFKGLIKYIKNQKSSQTRFLILTLIDVLMGKISRRNLTFFND